MELTIRPAAPSDHARLAQVAAEGDFADCESSYLSFISDIGRLLCSTVDGDVVAFGGMVPVGDIAMVTDLFVADSARGRGIGRRLLAELLDGRPRRMTFSAQHPAALAAYRREGMEPRGRMLYLSGSAPGGGAPLPPGEWSHGRDELVGYFVAQGATVTSNSVFTVGHEEADVLRIDSSDAIDACTRVLRAFDAGIVVTMYVPEQNSLAAWLVAHGFVVTDHDVLCTTEGVELPPTLAAMHPGLA